MQNPITLEEERKVWTIHQSVNGITYYYNRSTKKSQYEMPECFKITEEELDHPDWKEYRTAEGRKFYYNALTRRSCWHMPAEVKEWKLKMEEQKRIEREQRGDDEEEQKLSQAQITKRKFMALLKSHPITINTKWDSCIEICKDDQRWNLLRMGEKKKYFLEFIAGLKKINDQEKKAKVEASRVQFMKMLKQNKKLTSDCKMHRVHFDFITDPRWRMLEGVDRQNAFQDYMDQLVVKERQDGRLRKERNIQNLKILMQQQDIKYNMKWDQFRSMFRNNQCYKNLHPIDRINTFTSFIIEAEKKHEEDEQRQRRLKERTNRIQFRNFVKQKVMAGDISYKTKWRDFCKQFQHEEVLLNMLDPQQQGTSAHEIFQVFMHGIRQNHKLFKSEIKQHFKTHNFKMNEETSFEQFFNRLSDLPLYCEAKAVLQQYFYEYFKQKIRSKHNAKIQKQKQKEKEKQNAVKKAQKKERKIIFKIFKQIREQTKTKYNISEHLGFIETSLKEYQLTISPENIFKYFLAFLENQGNDKKSQSSSSERSVEKTEKKKKKKDKKDKHHKDETNDKDKQKEREKEKEKEREKSATTPVITKSITIPAELKPNNGDDMDIEEQGQIKDDEVILPVPIVVEKEKQKPSPKIHRKMREDSDSSHSKSKSKEKEKKKKKHKKKKNKVRDSSSDFD